MPRFLDDFTPGQSFQTPARTITETDIVNYAALTGDWNPVHTDAVFARDSAFGERIAHGPMEELQMSHFEEYSRRCACVHMRREDGLLEMQFHAAIKRTGKVD
jgi:hypothetical protein